MKNAVDTFVYATEKGVDVENAHRLAISTSVSPSMTDREMVMQLITSGGWTESEYDTSAGHFEIDYDRDIIVSTHDDEDDRVAFVFEDDKLTNIMPWDQEELNNRGKFVQTLRDSGFTESYGSLNAAQFSDEGSEIIVAPHDGSDKLKFRFGMFGLRITNYEGKLQKTDRERIIEMLEGTGLNRERSMFPNEGNYGAYDSGSVVVHTTNCCGDTTHYFGLVFGEGDKLERVETY